MAPHDQFIREQLAGDELDAVTDSSITATGFYQVRSVGQGTGRREEDGLDQKMTGVQEAKPITEIIA